MRYVLQLLFALVIVAIASAITYGLIKIKGTPEPIIHRSNPILVEIVKVVKQNVTFKVKTQGTVVPRTETVIIPEVSGNIISVSKSFNVGGFFEKGDLLLKIDTSDYEVSLVQAQAALARANLALENENAQSKQARKDWDALGKGEANSLVLRELQLKEAKSNVTSAQAEVDKAKRNLQRTEIRAPYDGMVKIKQVDVGQFVSRGTPMATIFAVDSVEISLPITSSDTAFLNLPQNHRVEDTTQKLYPVVKLKANIAGIDLEWIGNIIRTDGVIDNRSRVSHAIAQVQDPYSMKTEKFKPPLQVGTFVEAEITGTTMNDIFVLPRDAVRVNNKILIVDDKNTLRSQSITVIKADEKFVYIQDSLVEGSSVCLTPLEFVIEGMSVEPILVDDNNKS